MSNHQDDYCNCTVYITARIDVDNFEDANAVAHRLAERVFEHPMVKTVESQSEMDTVKTALG